MSDKAMTVEAQEELAQKAERVFGNLVIDKRRLPASQLQRRGIPSYVGEWVLDNIVPGSGPLTPDEAEKVQAWATRVVPGANDQGILKNRLLRDETVKVLTPVEVEIVLKRNRQDRVAKLKLLGIDDALIGDDLPSRYPDLLQGGMWGITELMRTEEGIVVASFKPM